MNADRLEWIWFVSPQLQHFVNIKNYLIKFYEHCKLYVEMAEGNFRSVQSRWLNLIKQYINPKIKFLKGTDLFRTTPRHNKHIFVFLIMFALEGLQQGTMNLWGLTKRITGENSPQLGDHLCSHIPPVC